MIRTTIRGPREFLVAGPVRGIAHEVPELLAALDAFVPSAVGLGVSREEMAGLTDHFAGRPAEPLVPLTDTEAAEIRGLARFGEVRVPNPGAVGALEWAGPRGVPLEPLDPSDETYAGLFAEHIGYVELVGRTLRERKLAKSPPEAANAEEFALAWHRSVGDGRGSRDLAGARDASLTLAARRLADRSGRVAVIVDRERYEAVVRGLAAP